MRSSSRGSGPRVRGPLVAQGLIHARRLLACGLVAAIAGCSGGGAQSGDTATPTAITASPAPASAAASASAQVIEDAGLETELAPGPYVSRLFSPSLAMDLGAGWFRREAGTAQGLDLRREPDGAADVGFMSGIGFLQCGAGGVVTTPDARAIVDAITASPKLVATAPVSVPVGDRSGLEIRLA